MKVIAKVKYDQYICEVSHDELEKFLNKYYGEMKKLEVNSEIDLGKGYDFFSDTKSALQKTQSFIKSNGEIIKTIIEGVKILGVDNDNT